MGDGSNRCVWNRVGGALIGADGALSPSSSWLQWADVGASPDADARQEWLATLKHLARHVARH